MNVQELRDALSAFPPEMKVTVDGYEGGVTEKVGLDAIRVRLNHNSEWWYGEHEETGIDDDQDDSYADVLCLRRGGS